MVKTNDGKYAFSKNLIDWRGTSLNISGFDHIIEKKAQTGHPYKKLGTHKNFNISNFSIDKTRKKPDPKASYIGIDLKDKKSNKSTYKINDGNYHTEYSKQVKLGSHNNSIEATFKFDQEKRHNQIGNSAH